MIQLLFCQSDASISHRWWIRSGVVFAVGISLILGASSPQISLAACIQDEHKEEGGEQSTKPATQHDAVANEDENHAADDQAHEETTGHADDSAHNNHGNASNSEYYLNKDHLIGHTADHPWFEIPSFGLNADPNYAFHAEDPWRKIPIPRISPWTEEAPLMKQPEGEAGMFIGPITFQPTKFVVLQLLAACIVGAAFIWLGRKVQNGDAPRGRLWNLLEVVVVYVRDQVTKPAIGSHDYQRFLPLIWTVFFFVLTMNLMGMFPLLGSPTGSISVTAALALCVFAVVLFTGMKKLGVVGFWTAQAPHIDLPGPMKAPLVLGIWAIEVFGLFVKHMVLAVRLFANMFAGHMVLAVIVGFIGVVWEQTGLFWLVTPASIGGSVAIGLLEVLVAFIQAYVFAFLTALFIGTAIHPH